MTSQQPKIADQGIAAALAALERARKQGAGEEVSKQELEAVRGAVCALADSRHEELKAAASQSLAVADRSSSNHGGIVRPRKGIRS